MATRLFVLMNNKLTEEQIEDAHKNLCVDEIIYAPNDILKIWENIPTEFGNWDVLEHITPVINWLANVVTNYDLVLVQGESVAMCYVVNWLDKERDITCVAEVTRQDTIEEIQHDGSTVKKTISKHVRFRKFFII